MKKTFLNLHKISIYAAIILVWCILSALILIVINIQTSLVAISILVFVAVLSLIRPFSLASWLATLAGALVYGLICYSLFGLSRVTAISSGVTSLIYLITSQLGNLFARQIGNLRDQYQKEQTLLDDLVQYDQATGILRWRYARKRLKAEVLRSVRYKKDLSLVLIQLMLPAQAKLSEDELTNLHGQIVDVMIDNLRKDIDIPFIGEKLGILLPETTTEGAQIFSARLVDRIFHKVRVDVAVGIASVPNDAVTEIDLLEQAETALKFAADSNQSVVAAARLHNVVEQKIEPLVEPILPPTETKPLVRPLEPNEWLLEILNFKDMDMLPDLMKQIKVASAAEDFRFVQLDGSRLMVKVTSAKQNLPAELDAQPQFILDKADQDQHLIQIKLKTDKQLD